MRKHLADRDTALARLAALGRKTPASDGPVSLGDFGNELGDELAQQLALLAGMYCDAFSTGIKTFPYLREA